MEESKSLNNLIEASDLLQMVEDLLNPSMLEKLSPATISGLRITVRNARQTVLNSHDSLASAKISRSTTAVSEGTTTQKSGNINLEKTVEDARMEAVTQDAAEHKISMSRRDLRTAAGQAQ